MPTWIDYTIAYLIGGIAVTLTAVIPQGTMSSTRSTWYDCIRPSITPPSIVFPIVWSILYFTIAVAIAHTILAEDMTYKSTLLALYAINLLFNVSWSFAYFGWRNMPLSLFVILCLWISALSIIVLTYMSLDMKWIGYLLIPYLLWLSFATILNGLSLKKEEQCKTFI